MFGGVSSEHEISLRSAASILAAVPRDRYDVRLLGIARDGTWRTGPTTSALADIIAHGELVGDLRALDFDVVFPCLHGPHGEDGTMQGLLEVFGKAYVGSGVLASALCMDKVAQKQLVRAAAPDVPLVEFRSVDARSLVDDIDAAELASEIARELGLPCFVKPANLGSSVGVEKVSSAETLAAAMRRAARYDHRLIVEAGVDAREIEVAVLGDGGPDTFVSSPGEIVLPAGVWYDYDTKYVKDVATLSIPAALPEAVASEIRRTALRAFAVTGCHGLARVDFLLDRHSGTAYLNELNTMPGFTSISMFPKLCEHGAIAYPDLIDRLCELAIARHAAKAGLSVW